MRCIEMHALYFWPIRTHTHTHTHSLTHSLTHSHTHSHTHTPAFVFFSCRIFCNFRGTIHPLVRTPCVAGGGPTSTGWWAPVRETPRFPTPPSAMACLAVPVSHRSTTLLCLGEVWPLMLWVGVWDMWEASNTKRIENIWGGSFGAHIIIEHFRIA